MRGLYIYITRDGIEWEFVRLRSRAILQPGQFCIKSSEQLMRSSFAATENPSGDWTLVKSRSTARGQTVKLSELKRLAARAYTAYLKDVPA